MTVLEFDRITKIYNVRGAGQMKALDEVSFTLESGRTLGLVGQSGSGKSTIAKILTQLETPTTGRVLLDGEPIPRHGKALRSYRQQLRMVFQDPFASLNPYHSIRYHIERPLQLDRVVPADQVDAEV
ncbi:MAG: ATP-binding cassette domain-containing protein, partial [Protaetiibacter sp.]